MLCEARASSKRTLCAHTLWWGHPEALGALDSERQRHLSTSCARDALPIALRWRGDGVAGGGAQHALALSPVT